MKTYENITFEEAVRIIYFHYSARPSQFLEMIEELMGSTDAPYKVISPKQYDDYRTETTDNKKGK